MHSFATKRVVTAALPVLAAVAALPPATASAATPGVPVHRLAAKALSIKSAYVTGASGKPRSSFSSGNAIVYHVNAANSSARTIKVTLNYWADAIFQSKGKLHQYIIVDRSVTFKMPPGRARFHISSHIPSGVTSAKYTLTGTIFQDSNRSDNAFGTSRPFTVRRVARYPLAVPYFSQFAESPRNNECGETSVAMSAAYYVDLYGTAAGKWISAVRRTLGISRSSETNARQLKKALWRLGEMQIGATTIPDTTPIDKVVKEITAATHAGHPVIAFVNARKLKPSRPYSGHWIVITGISGHTVYINDPDNLKPPQGTGKKKTTTLSLSVYKAAARSGAVGERQPYGLIVTGEDFQSP